MALLMMVGKCLPNTIKMGVHMAARKKELVAISQSLCQRYHDGHT